MVLYRRSRQEGGTFFFTVTLRNRSSSLLVSEVALLSQTMRSVQEKHPWETLGLVILPDHLHALWRLPPGDADFSGRWRAIKSGFVRHLKARGLTVQHNKKGEADIWQRRFWEHTIKDEQDFHHHLDYLHFNPVKHGYVQRVADWPWSTFHRYVHEGVLPENWAGPQSTC